MALIHTLTILICLAARLPKVPSRRRSMERWDVNLYTQERKSAVPYLELLSCVL
jgi:hypothetical protein